MRIDIISVVPDLLKSPFEASILKRAIDKGIVEIHLHNLRDYATDNYKSIDDYQFGGGAGMVMMVGPIDRCLSDLKSQRDYDEVIYMTLTLTTFIVLMKKSRRKSTILIACLTTKIS